MKPDSFVLAGFVMTFCGFIASINGYINNEPSFRAASMIMFAAAIALVAASWGQSRDK